MRRLFIFCLISFVVSGVASARSRGTTGATFLKIALGARPVSMGEAYVGLADDLYGIFWNPAGLPRIKSAEISAMHTEWFADIKYDFMGLALPLNNWQSLGLSFAYLNSGKIKHTLADRYGNYLGESGSFEGKDYFFLLAYGSQLTERIAWGTNLKLFQEEIADEKARGYAFDFGLLCDTAIKDLRAGLGVYNLGRYGSFLAQREDLPVKVSGGLAYTMSFNQKNKLICLGDLMKPVDNNLSLHLGSEYIRQGDQLQFKVRAGYKTSVIHDLGNESGFTLGFGIEYSNCLLDYAFVPYGILGYTQRISLSYRFGEFKTVSSSLSGELNKYRPAFHQVMLDTPEIQLIEERGKVKVIIDADRLFIPQKNIFRMQSWERLQQATRLLETYRSKGQGKRIKIKIKDSSDEFTAFQRSLVLYSYLKE